MQKRKEKTHLCRILHKCVILVDDQGAFATLKENLWFSEPFHGFSFLLKLKKKHLKRCFSLVDDQGLEPWAH